MKKSSYTRVLTLLLLVVFIFTVVAGAANSDETVSYETAFSWFKKPTKQNDISGFEDLLQRVNGFYQVFLSNHDSRSIDTIESLRKEKQKYETLIKKIETDIKELKKSAISSGDLSYMDDDRLAWWQKASINAEMDEYLPICDDRHPLTKVLSEQGKRELAINNGFMGVVAAWIMAYMSMIYLLAPTIEFNIFRCVYTV